MFLPMVSSSYNVTIPSISIDVCPNHTCGAAYDIVEHTGVGTHVDMNSIVAAVMSSLMILAIAMAWIRSYFYLGMGNKCLPYAPPSFMAVLKTPNSPDLTKYIRQDYGLLNCRLRLPFPKGFYLIGDYKLQRDIFLSSDKPPEMYQQYWFAKSKADLMFSPMNRHWKIVRKSIPHAFAPKEVRGMTGRCVERLETMLKPKLQQVHADGGTVDIREESMRFVFELFLDVAFEYTADPADFDNFFKEYTDVKKDMVRDMSGVSFIAKFYIPWLRWRIGQNVRVLAERIYQAYVNNPNKSDRMTLIRILHENNELTYHEKIDEVNLFIFAGHETTGVSRRSVHGRKPLFSVLSHKLCCYSQSIIDGSHFAAD